MDDSSRVQCALPPFVEGQGVRHKLGQARKVSHLNAPGHLLGAKEKLTPHLRTPPRVLGKIALSETLAPAEPPTMDDIEARRIARELVGLHRDGAISGHQDPEARFYAQLIHTFGGTYSEHA
jgi:hypothetical protein